MAETMSKMSFFRSYFDIAQKLEDDDRLAFYDAILQYVFAGKEPELEGMLELVFMGIKPNLDTSIRGSQKGREGGRGKTKNTEPKAEKGRSKKGESILCETEKAPFPKSKSDMDMEMDMDVDSEMDMDVDGADEAAKFAADALKAFNDESGQDVRQLSGTEFANLARIRDNGRTIEDIRRVVRRKRRQWEGDPRMAHFIRPSTIFGHFEEYVNEQEAKDDASDYAGIW